MIQSSPTRQLYTLRCEGMVLHGTCHPASPGSEARNQTGLLILSGFPMPRSAHGDGAVYWATDCAAHGYLTFRIDLPGMGDSFGDVPAELLPFTATGGYERVAAAAVKQIVERYQLDGVVILGHCSGAISAVFAAAVAKECRGLVLLDPPFFLPPQRKPKTKEALYHWLTSNPVTSRLLRLNDRLRQLRSRLRRQAELPANANLPMMARWKALARSGLPILVLAAPVPGGSGANPRVGKFNYMAHILGLAGDDSRVDFQVIEGANHSFSNDVSKAAVPAHVVRWMSTVFPDRTATVGATMIEAGSTPVRSS